MSRRETGSSLIGAVGRSDSLCPVAAGLVEWGGRASALPLYKREGRGTASFNPSTFISLHLDSFSPFAMARGRAGAPMGRRGSLLDSVPFLSKTSWRWSRQREEEGGGEAEAAVALGEEEDGAAHRPPLRQRPLPQWRAMSKTSPANSKSGCAGQCAVIFVSPLHSLGIWSLTHHRL